MSRLPPLRRLRIFPKSVFGQNLMLIALLVLVAGVSITAIFRHWVQVPRAQRLMDLIVVQARSTREWLLTADPERRTEVMARLQFLEDKDMVRYSVHRNTILPFISDTPDNSLVQAFIDTLAKRLGPHYEVNWQQRPTRRLWIGIPIDDTIYWIGLDAQVFVSGFAGVFVAIAIAGLALTLLAAILIQRRISWSLSRLSMAATDLGKGRRERLKTHDVPTEVAQVVSSFNQMAEQLDKTDSDRALMLAGVSHDLRTPLAKLRLGVEILSDEGDPEIVDGMIRHISDATSIIDQFINFARPGTEEPLLLTNINELVRDIASRQSYEHLRIHLEELPDSYCRPLALRRAILNLLENSLRYAYPAKNAVTTPDIWLKTRFDPSEQVIRIAVMDHGCGIEQADLDRMRHPFVRNNDARSNIPGAGLGLSIVERIAILHGGHLVLSSPPASGLTAVIVLPLNEETQDAQHREKV